MEKIENQQENQQVAARFNQLNRQAADVIDAGIQLVAVNGEAKRRLNAVAAAAEKAADPAEYMEQRHQHGKEVKEMTALDALVEFAVNRNGCQSSEKAAVEHHAADTHGEQLPEAVKPQLADMLKSENQRLNIRKRKDNVCADENTDADRQHQNQQVKQIHTEASDQKPADQRAEKTADHDHDSVGSDFLAEDYDGRKHKYPLKNNTASQRLTVNACLLTSLIEQEQKRTQS